jgi:ABC-2 type transport system ATP-binding protein
MSEAAPALRCVALVKRYADVTAVSGLDLEVVVGECFGLLGPNGAGKTTTVEILEGLTQPDSGRVEVPASAGARDAPPARLRHPAPGDQLADRHRRRRCGWVFSATGGGSTR